MSAATPAASRSGNPSQGRRSISQSISNPFPFLKSLSQGGRVAFFDGLVERREPVFEPSQRIQYGVAVLREDLCPQPGVACGDARRVAPARAGQPQPLFGRRGRQCGGNQMRQVTGRGQCAIVLFRGKQHYLRANRLPKLLYALYEPWRRLVFRSYDYDAALKEVGA